MNLGIFDRRFKGSDPLPVMVVSMATIDSLIKVPRGLDLLIVGGGLAGLAAARVAAARGADWLLFEGSDTLGGRVGTDLVPDPETGEPFVIDRGFQVLLTGYAELEESGVLPSLALGRFEPGAHVRVTTRSKTRFHRALDVWRRPMSALTFDWRHVFSPGEAMALMRMRRDVRNGNIESTRTTRDELVARGFSERALARFFVPFWGGVLLDRELAAPWSFTARLFDAFSRGDAAIPIGGMRALPAALATGLDPDRIVLRTKVQSVGQNHVILDTGARLVSGRVLVATDGDEASRLLPESIPTTRWRATTSCYYASQGPMPAPLDQRLLILDGDGLGPLHHLAPLSSLGPGFAPEGRGLVVASHDGVADPALEPALGAELRAWFPDTTWSLIAVRAIARGLPVIEREPTDFALPMPGLAGAGDHIADRSIDCALRSGRLAAQALFT